MRTPEYLLIRPSSRTVDGIQENIVKRSRRNVISRHYHAKDDKEAIATWRLDLNRVWHVFNVRSIISVWLLLTFRFQTELRIDTRATGSDARQDATNEHTVIFNIHHNVANAETTVSGVRRDVSNTQPIVSDVHRTKLKSREGANYQNQVVSTTRTLSPSKYLPLPRLTLGQRSRLQLNPVSNAICIQSTRGVATLTTGKYAWNHLQYPSRCFRCSSRRCEDSNYGLRHSWHAEKSARGWWPTSARECHPYSVSR